MAGIRPEAVELAESGGGGALAGTVVQVEALGHETLVHVRLAGGGSEAPVRWVVREHGMAQRRSGDASSSASMTPRSISSEPTAAHSA